MDLEIRYVTTGDGTRIAYGEAGAGPALVYCQPFPYSHAETTWRKYDVKSRMAQGRRLIVLDDRGSGYSTRHPGDYSLTAMVRDLETVVDHLGLASFAIFAENTGCLSAIPYAAEHPEKVSHLILHSGFARGRDFQEMPRWSALNAILALGD